MDIRAGNRAVRGLILLAAAVLLWSGATAAMFRTVEVTSPGGAVTRACGSPFDAISGRSGWEIWWARDLDEPDDATRGRLVRTSLCPDAVNGAIVASTALGGLGILAGLAGWLTLRRPAIGPHPVRRLVRLGWVTAVLGALLSLGGLAATAVLLADPEAPLFLYTSRSVAAAVALIVLTPALALVVAGGALVMVANMVAEGRSRDDPA